MYLPRTHMFRPNWKFCLTMRATMGMRTQGTKVSARRCAFLSSFPFPCFASGLAASSPLLSPALHLLPSSLALLPLLSPALSPHPRSRHYLSLPLHPRSLTVTLLSLFHRKLMLTPSPQVDWIGDKLALLIEQGKKALSRQIVVMSDAAKDEVDDASGAWEEQHPAHDRGSVPVHPAKRRPRPDAPPAAIPISGSPLIPPPMPTHSPTPSAVVGADEREDKQAWESAELRKLMERARAKARERAR